MQQIFFILGRDPELSSAEIFSLLVKEKIEYKTDSSSREILVVSVPSLPDLKLLMKNLGGVIKIGKIIDTVGYEEDEGKFEKIISAQNLLEKYFPSNAGKIHFGISIYLLSENNPYVAQLIRRQKEWHIQVKKNLQAAGYSAGFVQIKERFLSSVSVAKNGLLTSGAEIVMIGSSKAILVGRTEAVQEFSSFSFRDYYRPAKDKKSGIMPPKLARMMINLSEIKPDGMLLDPFCGSGTVIQEGIFLNIKNITGTDISDRAISDTMSNIDWLFTHYRELDRKYFDLSIRKTDVRQLDRFIQSNSLDAIVTEPLLGPPLKGRPDINSITNIFKLLKPLYLNAFAQFYRALKTGGSVVIIFPAFEAGGKIISMEINEDITNLGFIPVKINTQEPEKYSLIVGDKYSYLKREIFKYTKVGTNNP